MQEDRPTGREQGKEDLSFLDKKLSQEGKRERNSDFYTLPKERNEEKRKSSLDILQVNSPDQIEEELEEYYDEKNKKEEIFVEEGSSDFCYRNSHFDYDFLYRLCGSLHEYQAGCAV